MPVGAIVAQCGGPTAVINASLAAVIAAWQTAPGAGALWGSRFGVHGLVHGHWVELSNLGAEAQARLRAQPGAALGSSRYRIPPGDLPALLQRLAAVQIGVLLLIGGNGTMAAAQAIQQAAAERGFAVEGRPLCVVGIPKTVDNDLVETEAAPGYGSAARFIAETTRSIGLDLRSMAGYDQVVVLEVMGRHVGWLAAAAALARTQPDDPPHLILTPEMPFDAAAFLARVQAVQQEQQVCLVVAAEGLRDAQGAYLAEAQQPAQRDASGQRMLGLSAGVAPHLAQLIQSRLGLRCRQLRPDTIQRSSRALASPVDQHLAELCGAAAALAAQEGRCGIMVGVTHRDGAWRAHRVSLAQVAGRERTLPPAFYRGQEFEITPAFVDYARPLVGELSPAPIRF